MKILGAIFIVFGVAVIIFPAILVFLVGAFFVFIGINLIAFFAAKNNNKDNKEDYVQFGKYKIYR